MVINLSGPHRPPGEHRGGCIRHLWWSPGNRGQEDLWRRGVDSEPAASGYRDQQHVFAVGTDGRLQHIGWTP